MRVARLVIAAIDNRSKTKDRHIKDVKDYIYNIIYNNLSVEMLCKLSVKIHNYELK